MHSKQLMKIFACTHLCLVLGCFYGMAVKKRVRRELTTEQKIVRKWVLDNRGILRHVAEESVPRVTEQYVQLVAYGHTSVRSSHPILRQLKAAGWPGVK